MDNKELKQWILDGCQGKDDPLVFKYEDNPFLSNQYATAIAQQKHLEKLSINSIAEINTDNSFLDYNNNFLYVYEVEELQEDIDPKLEHLVVICKKLPKNLSVDFIEIVKLQNWQIEDFVKARLNGLQPDQIKWLCEIANYDIYRLDCECKKIEIFDPAEQPIIFDQLNDDDGYCDLNTLKIFDFTNAIMKKDMYTVNAILSDLKYIDVEATGLITIFRKQFKNLIDIQMNPRATADTLGMKPGQFYAISQNKNRFTNNQLVKIYQFITSLDYRLKNGELTFQTGADHLTNNNHFVDYITTNLLVLGAD